MDFRPHLNVLGHSSTGKGWVRTNLIERFLSGSCPVNYYGNTSTHPAFLEKMAELPPSIVLLDEKEGKKTKKDDYKTEWLECFRLASTEKEPYYEKCGRGNKGGLKKYPLKFIVSLFSIKPYVKEIEDVNRFITVQMFKKMNPQQKIYLHAVLKADIEKIALGCYSFLFNRWDEFSKKRESNYNLFLSHNLTGHFSNKWAIILALADMFFFNRDERKAFFNYILSLNETEENPALMHENILENILNYPYTNSPERKDILFLLKNPTVENKQELKTFLSQGIKVSYPFLLFSKKSHFINERVFKNREEERDSWFSLLSSAFPVKRKMFSSTLRSLAVCVELESFLNEKEVQKFNVLESKTIIEKEVF